MIFLDSQSHLLLFDLFNHHLHYSNLLKFYSFLEYLILLSNHQLYFDSYFNFHCISQIYFLSLQKVDYLQQNHLHHLILHLLLFQLFVFIIIFIECLIFHFFKQVELDQVQCQNLRIEIILNDHFVFRWELKEFYLVFLFVIIFHYYLAFNVNDSFIKLAHYMGLHSMICVYLHF